MGQVRERRYWDKLVFTCPSHPMQRGSSTSLYKSCPGTEVGILTVKGWGGRPQEARGTMLLVETTREGTAKGYREFSCLLAISMKIIGSVSLSAPKPQSACNSGRDYSTWAKPVVFPALLCPCYTAILPSQAFWRQYKQVTNRQVWEEA